MSREIEVPGESYEAALVRERVARRQAEAALAACRERWRATEAQVEAFRTALVEAETEAKYHYTSESLNFNNLDGRLTAIVVPIGKWDALAALSRVSRSEPAPPNEHQGANSTENVEVRASCGDGVHVFGAMALCRCAKQGSSPQWAEGREGMVTVYDHLGQYLGCMGVATWREAAAPPVPEEQH